MHALQAAMVAPRRGRGHALELPTLGGAGRLGREARWAAWAVVCASWAMCACVGQKGEGAQPGPGISERGTGVPRGPREASWASRGMGVGELGRWEGGKEDGASPRG